MYKMQKQFQQIISVSSWGSGKTVKIVGESKESNQNLHDDRRGFQDQTFK